jgi:hypothetical protein
LEATGVGKAVFLRVWEVATEVRVEKYGNICAVSLRRDECQSETILGFFELKQQNGEARRHRSAQLIAFAPGRVMGHSQEIIEGGSW